MSLVRLWGCDAHLLPGRLRLHLPGLHRNPRFARRIEQRLRTVEGVQQITANPDTGRLLLHFDPTRLELESVGSHLKLNQPTAPPFPSRREALAQALIPGVALATVAIKRWLLGPSALSQSWVTYDLAGLVTGIASYPFLRRGVIGLLERRRISGDFLIGIAGLTMALMRENLYALSALCLSGVINLHASAAMADFRSASGREAQQSGSVESAVLTARSLKLASRWGAIAVGAAIVTGVVTLNWRRALATLIAAAPAAAALVVSLPLGTAVVRARQQGMPVCSADTIAASGSLEAPPTALRSLGRQAVRTVNQNMLLMTGLNGIGLGLAVTGAIGPLGASLWHNLTALAIQFNAVKLLRCQSV